MLQDIETANPIKSIREIAKLSIGQLADKLALNTAVSVSDAANIIEEAERIKKNQVPLSVILVVARAAGIEISMLANTNEASPFEL
jgi:uncharacterized protein YybS (DUF2232 family)